MIIKLVIESTNKMHLITRFRILHLPPHFIFLTLDLNVHPYNFRFDLVLSIDFQSVNFQIDQTGHRRNAFDLFKWSVTTDWKYSSKFSLQHFRCKNDI